MLRPRLRAVPDSDGSAVEETVALAAASGLHLDPWQRLALEHALATTGAGEAERWASFEVGLIVPRQNGKGAVLEARELAGLFLFGEKTIMHSAHEFKALDVETPMLTPRGWVRMGDLLAGDEVYAPDGQPTKVVAAHPIRYDRPCYRLTFDDGQQIVADAEHLWSVTDRGQRRVVTTQEMVDGGVVQVQPRSGRVRRTYRYRLDVPEPLAGEPIDTSVHPWLLGAWLGDGTTTKGELTCGAQDLDYTLARLTKLGETFRVRPDRRWPDRVFTIIIDGLFDRLRQVGVLGAKHIPDRYLTCSVEQRRDLLAGIMDTDGTVGDHQIAVTMSKARLMDDVVTLVRSLGYKATLRTFRAQLNGADAGPMYRMQMARSQSVSPFQMPRKTAAVRPRQEKLTRAHYNAVVSIDSVETRPTRCITVAHESACYLAGRGLAPTHNTAADHFRRMSQLIKANPQLLAEVQTFAGSHGSERIELKNGSRLLFVARTGGSGRGFPADLIVLDEAYNLTQAAMSALTPTLTTSPNPQIWYTSSSVNQEIHPNGHVLARVRRRGMRGGDRRLCYLEWSVDEDVYNSAPDKVILDRSAWAQANPALGTPRLSLGYIEGELGVLDAQGFATERLGVGDWPSEDAGDNVIPMETWSARLSRPSEVSRPLVFAIDVPPSRNTASIVSARFLPTGQVFVEVLPRPDWARKGVAWVPREARRLQERWGPAAWVLDKVGPGAGLAAKLEERYKSPDGEPRPGLRVETTTGSEMAVACGEFYDDVISGQLRHGEQRPLTQAVRNASTRKLLDRWAWSRTGLTDISPLVAATLARYGLVKYGSKKPPARPQTEAVAPSQRGAADDLATINF